MDHLSFNWKYIFDAMVNIAKGHILTRFKNVCFAPYHNVYKKVKKCIILTFHYVNKKSN